MNPTLLFSIFTLIAFSLFVTEVFIPGGIVGLIGAGCLLIACGFAIAAFGFTYGSFVALGMVGLTIAGFMFWLSKMPNSKIGQRFSLQTSLKKSAADSAPSPLIGKVGTAETDLRPSGFAQIDDKRIDVVANRGYIDKGTSIKVIEVHGSRVVVNVAPESSV